MFDRKKYFECYIGKRLINDPVSIEIEGIEDWDISEGEYVHYKFSHTEEQECFDPLEDTCDDNRQEDLGVIIWFNDEHVITDIEVTTDVRAEVANGEADSYGYVDAERLEKVLDSVVLTEEVDFCYTVSFGRGDGGDSVESVVECTKNELEVLRRRKYIVGSLDDKDLTEEEQCWIHNDNEDETTEEEFFEKTEDMMSELRQRAESKAFEECETNSEDLFGDDAAGEIEYYESGGYDIEVYLGDE